MPTKLANLPPPSVAWVDSQGKPTIAFTQFMNAIAAANIGPLISAANDELAAQAGVPVNGLYETAGVVKIRLS